MLDKAILLASEVHLGVEDKGGQPYILHPLRLMMRLRTTDQELMAIAVLHDVVEDGDITFDELLKRGFTERVVAALRLLTHAHGDSYELYIEKMKDNLDALRVKREDLRDNSDITRLRGLEEKDFKRMAKYQRSFVRVEQLIKGFGCG